jgi:hypothetical protein
VGHCPLVWQPGVQHCPPGHASHTVPPPQSASDEHPPVLAGGLLAAGFALTTGLLDSTGLCTTTAELAGATLSWVGVAGVTEVGVVAPWGAEAGGLAWALVASSARIPGSGGAEDDELQPQRVIKRSAGIAWKSRIIRCLSF